MVKAGTKYKIRGELATRNALKRGKQGAQKKKQKQKQTHVGISGESSHILWYQKLGSCLYTQIPVNYFPLHRPQWESIEDSRHCASARFEAFKNPLPTGASSSPTHTTTTFLQFHRRSQQHATLCKIFKV